MSANSFWPDTSRHEAMPRLGSIPAAPYIQMCHCSRDQIFIPIYSIFVSSIDRIAVVRGWNLGIALSQHNQQGIILICRCKARYAMFSSMALIQSNRFGGWRWFRRCAHALVQAAVSGAV